MSNYANKAKYAAQTTTVRQPKLTAGWLGTIVAYNPNSVVSYIQFFDLATTVTLGTTTPDEVFAVPPLSTLVVDSGARYLKGIQFACSTTATGNTAPSTGLDITVRWG